MSDPSDGVWRTINGQHVFIRNSAISSPAHASTTTNEAAHPTMPLPNQAGHGSAVYNLKDQAEGDLDTHVERRKDGSYYARADNFDFEAPTAEAMRTKLRKYGATYAGWEND